MEILHPNKVKFPSWYWHKDGYPIMSSRKDKNGNFVFYTRENKKIVVPYDEIGTTVRFYDQKIPMRMG